jgi:hypothetical protein
MLLEKDSVVTIEERPIIFNRIDFPWFHTYISSREFTQCSKFPHTEPTQCYFDAYAHCA